MSQKVQILRSLVEQRLTAATEEIFGLFERAITEHEEEFFRTKEENRRLRQMLDEVLNPVVPKTVSHPEIQVVQVVKEERQEWSPSQVQECPQLPRIKEEEKELLIIQEQLQVPERAVTTQTTTVGKTEDGGETTLVSQFYQGQTVENTMEAPEADYGGSDPGFPSDNEYTDNSSDSEDGNNAHKQKRRRHSYLHPKTAPPSAILYENVRAEANGEEYGSPKPGSSMKRELQADSDDKTENSSDSEGDCEGQKRGKSKSKRHQCAECNKVFSTGQFLKKHKKTTVKGVHSSGSKPGVHKESHTGRKWYSCPVCRKTFFHKLDVQRHMKVHSQEKTTE